MNFDPSDFVTALAPGATVPGATQAVFGFLFARDCRPYAGHPDAGDWAGFSTPMFLMIYRSDGLIGFPGGTADDADFEGVSFHEGLVRAVTREMREEIGFEFQSKDTVPLCTHYHSRDNRVTHMFAQKVDFETLKRLRIEAPQRPGFDGELMGIILHTAVAHETNNKRGIYAPFRQASHPSVREELYEALKAEHMVPAEALAIIARDYLSPDYSNTSRLTA